ncbi:MAG: hypothetical protein ABIQ31_18275 [Ferruginibacter sp.]
MIFYRFIILLTVLQFWSFCCEAQDNNYVYKDSAILYEDSAAAQAPVVDLTAPAQSSNDNETGDEYIADTVLRVNELFVEPDSIRSLQNSRPFAYAKNLDSLLKQYKQNVAKEDVQENTEPSWLGSFFLSSITVYFFWILAGVFICFILYKLFFAEGFFQRSYARINVTALPEEQENLSATADYGKLINQALANRNYRLAVRYHYLQSLQKLSTKGVIQFAADKTNYQYVRELSGKAYKNSFASLTLNYEYVWYGEFEVNENIYQAIQDKFKQFNSEV